MNWDVQLKIFFRHLVALRATKGGEFMKIILDEERSKKFIQLCLPELIRIAKERKAEKRG